MADEDVLISESNGHKLVHKPNGLPRYDLDGEPVKGGSTISEGGFPTSEGLISWKAGEAAEYVIDTLPGLLKEKPKLTVEDRKKLVGEAKLAHKKKSREATDIGSLVHDYCYYHQKEDKQKLLDTKAIIAQHKDVKKIQHGIDQYEKWAQANNDTDKHLEELVASVTYKFGGRYDYRAYRPGVGIVLADYKTSSGIFITHFIQLGAYSVALREWTGVQVDALEILNFHKTGDFNYMIIKDKDEIQAFEQAALRCLETFNFKNKWEADVRFRRKWK